MSIADGNRIAIVGAGPAGAAFAGALLSSARAFGRKLEVVLFDGHQEREVEPPALLDADARARLASLGASLPFGSGGISVEAVLVHAAGRSALLEPPSGGLWIVDRAGDVPGHRALKGSLLAAASLKGARIRPWRVDAVEDTGERVVVRAQGSSEAFDLAVGAFGSGSEIASRWMDGRYRPPHTLWGSHARLEWPGRDDLIRVCVQPTPEVEALLVVPCGQTAWAVAIGEDVELPGLARALMAATRDRALPTGVHILAAERLAIGAGGARKLARGAALVVGAAAIGQPLEPGVLPALLSAVRSASAVLEVGNEGSLARRLVSSQADLLEHARHQRKVLRWLPRCGDRAPAALARLSGDGRMPGSGLGLLGLSTLPSGPALGKLRMEGIKRIASDLLAPVPAPYPEPPSGRALVFVVDDDPDVRGMLTEFLGSRGVAVRAFEDEMALLEAAARERPGAILLDIVLRWVDGMALCRALRAHPATAKLRIIAMSNLTRRSDREAALAAGADAFLPKPIDLADLERALTGAFGPADARQDGAYARANPG